MIPFFVATIVNAIVAPFGRTVYVTGTHGRRGIDSIHIVRLPRWASRPRKLKPWDGGALTPIADGK